MSHLSSVTGLSQSPDSGGAVPALSPEVAWSEATTPERLLPASTCVPACNPDLPNAPAKVVPGSLAGGYFRAIFFLIGCLLSFTAGAKLWLLWTDPFADLHTPYPLWILWSVAFAELVAVFFLVCRCSLELKSSIVAVLFFAFLLVSCLGVLVGSGSCGCAGGIEVPPTASLLVNLLVLVANGLVRRQHGLTMIPRPGLNHLAARPGQKGTGFAAGMPAVLSGMVAAIWLWGCLHLIRTDQALKDAPQDRGISASVVPLIVAGDNATSRSTVRIENHSDHPATISGIKTSCSCLAAFPESNIIPAGGSCQLELTVGPGQAGPFHYRLILYVDSGSRLEFVSVVVSGQRFSEGSKS